MDTSDGTSENQNIEYLQIDPLAEVIIGLLIVRADLRPARMQTYDDARRFAEMWSRRLRGIL